MTADDDLVPLADTVRGAFMAAGHAAANDVLSTWPRTPYRLGDVASAALPVLAHLPTALDAVPAVYRTLAEELGRSAQRLNWRQTYGRDDMSAKFLARYGWTLLIGPGEAIESDILIVGFLLLGPGVEYPPHRHGAEETYLVISGHASWMTGEAGWSEQTPGAVIHNPPWRPHGMRTPADQPLLAAALWRGGTLEKSRFELT